MEAERQLRLESYRREASGDRDRAVRCGHSLAAKGVGRGWVARAKPGDERQMGPERVPRTQAEATKLMARFPEPTPYEAAHLFVMAWYRLRSMRGARSRATTLAMLRQILHPDHFLPAATEGGAATPTSSPPASRPTTAVSGHGHRSGHTAVPAGDYLAATAPRRIRKHVQVALDRGGVDAPASFVAGASPMNMYDVVAGNFVVVVKSGEETYRNVHDARYTVDVRFSGAHRYGDCYRSLGLRYVAGAGWKADDFAMLANCTVEEPFCRDGAESIEEYQREVAYRDEFRLPKIGYVYVNKSKIRGYEVPRAYEKGLERVDLELARRKLRREREAAAARGEAEPQAQRDKGAEPTERGREQYAAKAATIRKAARHNRSRSVTPEKPVVPAIGHGHGDDGNLIG